MSGHFHSPDFSIQMYSLFIFQALPLMTVFVGQKTDTGVCRVETLSFEKDSYTEFPVPTAEKPLEKGWPFWANYVKGVVANFKGE
jgi:galactokinase